jgi:uncharacterized protein
MSSSASLSCRSGCGACCTAPSITSPIPGMPGGKRAGERCVQLNANNACLIFGQPERPLFCIGLQPSREMCGDSQAQAILWLTRLELLTRPDQESAAL